MQIPIAGPIQDSTELKDEERYEVGKPEDHVEEYTEGEEGRFNRKAPRGVQRGDSSSTELDAVVSVLAALFLSKPGQSSPVLRIRPSKITSTHSTKRGSGSPRKAQKS